MEKTNIIMTTTTVNAKRSNVWNVILWVAQVIVAGMFLMAGLMKVSTPLDELSKMMPLAKDAPVLIRFIGLSELAGGLGLLLPAALRIKPWLTRWAAIALVVVMVLALIYHISRGEISSIGINIVLGVLAGFIAWGRAGKAPISAKA